MYNTFDGAMFWELVISHLLRGFLGVCFSIGLGIAGYFVGWILSPLSLGFFHWIVFRMCGVGIGAGIGGLAGWLSPGQGQVTIFTTLGLALVGGLAGAWGGLAYGMLVWDDVLSQGALRVIIAFAALLANVLPLLASIYRIRRGRTFQRPSLAPSHSRSQRPPA